MMPSVLVSWSSQRPFCILVLKSTCGRVKGMVLNHTGVKALLWGAKEWKLVPLFLELQPERGPGPWRRSSAFPGNSLALVWQGLEGGQCGLLGCVQRFSEVFLRWELVLASAGRLRPKLLFHQENKEFGSHHLFRRRAIEAKAVFWKHLVVCSTRCSWPLALGCRAGMRLSSQAWAWTTTGCPTVPPGDKLLLLILPSLGIFIVSSFERS